jgi:CelD/BcsL family acetyltransferase involved in cellulose biosynthesis
MSLTAAGHAVHAPVEPVCAGLNAVSPYRAAVLGSLDEFLQHAEPFQGPGCLPFHGPGWLRAWYETLGSSEGRRPLWLLLQRCSAGQWVDAMLLPLVQQRRKGLREVAFADAGVVDYVAPLVAADWHGGAEPQDAAKALWRAMARALRGFDVWRVQKMLPAGLPEAGAVTNPLQLVWRTHESDMFGNQFVVQGPWEEWRHSLDKRVRKEIERCWRVFERSPVARLERVRDPVQAQALFDTLEQQQSERLGALPHYRLNRAPYRAFYRRLLAAGLTDGSVVLTALRDGDTVVSALFGVANGQRYIALRQSIGGPAWKALSPGRLLDEGTARQMHAAGLNTFDFGVGDYFHKTTLGMQPIALRDACVALSWRGVPARGAWYLRRWAKRRVKPWRSFSEMVKEAVR